MGEKGRLKMERKLKRGAAGRGSKEVGEGEGLREDSARREDAERLERGGGKRTWGGAGSPAGGRGKDGYGPRGGGREGRVERKGEESGAEEKKRSGVHNGGG